MNTAEIGSDVVEVLSRITGQKLNQRDITPTLLFATNLITVLLGVILADGEISPEEKQQFQHTLNLFIPPQGNMRQLVQLLGKGVKQNKVYAKSKVIQALSEPLSEPEKLLLLGLGYEMSAADGSIDATEKRYLDAIASKVFQLNPRYGTVFETALTQPEQVDAIALMELEFLLNPGRFQNLDLAFIEAASQLLERLQAAEKPQETVTPKTSKTSESVAYESLRQFQAQKRNLDKICMKLYQVLQDCVDQSFIPATLTQDLGKISQKLQSQSFRVAVVGEFSQGKSTLLNALLGEEIQPTRAIPCSGTVAILRYGQQQRVICRYQDGREEIISSELYQEKVAIPREEALGQDSLTERLATSDLTEIIFEHPGLELCKNGVEIIDSPGLNEHPARTAITQRLIKESDAVLFLTNAQRQLTETERNILEDLRTGLNQGQSDRPALSLFIIVNYMDLVNSDQDREDVKQRVKNIVLGQSPIIAGENRIHFISAWSALKSKKDGIENEYLVAFNQFYQSLENFLIQERGQIQIKQAATDIETTIETCFAAFDQYQQILSNNITFSEQSKFETIEKIGEISGRSEKLLQELELIWEESSVDLKNSWNQYFSDIDEKIMIKSKKWKCESKDKNKIAAFYSKKVIETLEKEIENWLSKEYQEQYLKPKLIEFNTLLEQELTAIQNLLEIIDVASNSQLTKQFTFSRSKFKENLKFDNLFNNYDEEIDLSLFASLGSGGIIATALYSLTLIAVGPIALIGLATAAGVGAIFGVTGEWMRDDFKNKIIQKSIEEFSKRQQQIADSISDAVDDYFGEIKCSVEGIIEQGISLCENLINQYDQSHQANQVQNEMDKVTLSLKCQEIEQIEKKVNNII